MSDPELFLIANESFVAEIRALSDKIRTAGWQPDFIVGIGRGGLVPAVYISHRLNLPMLSIDHSSREAGFADELLGKVASKSAAGTRLLFVDDINDSGDTIAYIRDILGSRGCDEGNLRFAVLLNNLRSKAEVDYWSQTIDRASDKRWFVFPWEAMATDDRLVDEALSVPGRLA